MTKESVMIQLEKDMEDTKLILGRGLTESEKALYSLAWIKGAQARGEKDVNNISDSDRSINKH